ncbi:MAG: tRNA uridine-5-carboxymethylaminomethyl(34) synthesis GTPase MnmE [Bacilli bacterium]|nr:tRNA uridine-5-carboxymethylaminomethyl(34) synthesis GTPase MnmE [Bacilli bacterium]MDD4795127.1 tRNA uridine-5-carboxymethylaminomethyl(34) synthesis GTPase MnmE [Bacilli bacterium]
MDSTICAVSTAIGSGAISIIRCSGKDAIKIVNSVFSGVNLEKVLSHTIHYGFINFKNEKIDEVLVSVMRSPKTFTTEDIVEINSHGGIATTNKILEILLTSGCKLAEAGEFTKRAFLNGRIDLLEAEAVGDLILSETENSRKLAINQITGSLSHKINNIRQKLISLQANIEVNIDYPEYDDILVLTAEILKPTLTSITGELQRLLVDSKNGKIIKNGLDVAIIGQPNVGKSSILNALLEENKAIVTNIPGTTRDIVEGKISLNGIILNIIDTAGLRVTSDQVEKIGVEKSREICNLADLIIYVIDNTTKNIFEDLKYLKTLSHKPAIVFINKDDKNSNIKTSELKDYQFVFGNTIKTSGLNNLKNKIVEIFNLEELETKDFSYLSSARQISLVSKAISVIEEALKALENGASIDLISIDIKKCYELLGEIVGETYKEDLLDELFSKFCLGK